MKEYLRTEGDAVTIPYTAPLGTDAVVFSVYDLDLEEYVQSDESLAKRATVTAASGNGTIITYTASNTFAVGDTVTITGLSVTTGLTLNKTNVVIATRSDSQFTVTDSTIGTSIATQSGTALQTTSDFDLVLDQDVTTYDRRLRIELQIIDASSYTEDEIYASIIRPYATTTELADYAGLEIVNGTPGFGEITEAELIKLERKARLYINSRISDSFNFNYKTVGVLGQGTDVLYMGQRIQSFDKIIKDDEVIYDITADPEINLLDYPFAVTNGKNSLKVVWEGENIIEWSDTSVINSSGYFERNSLYLVRGEYGWKYVPNDINQATLELVNDMICSDFNYRNRGVKSVKNDAYTIEFQPGTGIGSILVESLIAPYKRLDLWAV
jgi:hypothetical protein